METALWFVAGPTPRASGEVCVLWGRGHLTTYSLIAVFDAAACSAMARGFLPPSLTVYSFLLVCFYLAVAARRLLPYAMKVFLCASLGAARGGSCGALTAFSSLPPSLSPRPRGACRSTT
mmetsp:Transcript_125469/g.390618  ORF Transcript_125469/g.390618 Transcript_125469/m.390618 type:complete len:120 (-) Transcript_125469:179-538(-)